MEKVRAAAARRFRSGVNRIRKAAPSADQTVDWLQRRRTDLGRLRSRIGSDKTTPSSPPADVQAEPPVKAEPTVQAEPPATTITSRLLAVSWQPTADGIRPLRIEGAAWRRYGTQPDSRVTAVELIGDGDPIPLAIEQVDSPAFNDISQNPAQDRSSSGFVATLDPSTLSSTVDPDAVFERQWRFKITVEDAAGQASGRFQHRDEAGSAGQLHSSDAGASCLAQPGWDNKRGLLLTVARRALIAESLQLNGNELTATINCRGDFVPTTALLRRNDDLVRLDLIRTQDGRFAVSGSVATLLEAPPDNTAARSWYLLLADAEEKTRHVHWRGDARHGHREVSSIDPRLAIRFGPNGVIRLDLHSYRLVVDNVSADLGEEPTLAIEGECHGLSDDPANWVLAGGRNRLQPRSLEVADGRFLARFSLTHTAEWGRRPLPLSSADYRLTVRRDDDEVPALLDSELAETLIQTIETDTNKIDIVRDRGNLLLRVGPPLAPGERSRYHYRQLEIMHRTSLVQPTDTVVLDSFDGKAANDNTRAVADALARRRPDLKALWTVADLSVEIPEGAEPLIIKSDAWWQALTNSRYLVTNCWLPGKFQRPEHQRVLQTWHGTPLKLLGFDRIGTKRGDEYRRKTLAEVAQWQQLISQNPYSSKIFQSAYGFEGQLLEIGYPRNDILSLADDDHRRAIRDRLGIGADELVILYVPTWRENAKGLFSELDFDAVGAALGDSGRLLVRGHANTIRHGQGVAAARLLDVTLYPELADLYLISDVMITDYSSTMFDFSVTGKPIIFFAPDLDDYSGKLRGTYFDLAEEAPGPVLKNTGEVIDALRDLDQLRTEYADRYAGWQQKYNPYDDGHASERAVDALLGTYRSTNG